MTDSWWSLAVHGRAARLEVVGTIGAVHDDLIDALEALDVDMIDLYVDSPGGSAAAGLMIAGALVRHPAKVVTQIGYRCHSAAVDIALAGSFRRIHWHGEVVTHVAHLVESSPELDGSELDQVAGQLERLDAWSAGSHALQTGAGHEPGTFGRRCAWWRQAMRDERRFLASEAVWNGLAHEIGGDWTGPGGIDVTEEEAAEIADSIPHMVAAAVADALASTLVTT